MPSFANGSFDVSGTASSGGMVELVARDSGPYIVYADDVEISRHTTERKAADSAIETAINLAFDNPDAYGWVCV